MESSKSTTEAKSWEKIGSAYKGTTTLKRLYEAPAVESFLKRAKEECPEQRLLDIGCGVGKYMEMAISLGYSDMVGFDPAASMVEGCRAALAECAPDTAHCHIMEGCVLSMDTMLEEAGQEAGFSSAMMVYVACNLSGRDEVKLALRQSAKALRSGGKLLIVDHHPFKQEEDYYTSEAQPFQLTLTMENGDSVTFENRRYTLGFWVEALQEAGLVLTALKEPSLAQDVFEGMGSPDNLKRYVSQPGLGMYLECLKP